jgi:DNA-binding NtrC family response regulator
MNFIKVLVVDDDSIIRDLIVTFLQLHGFLTKTVNNGEEAIATLDNERFHAVITDLIMGKVNGHQVLRHVKKLKPATVRIMITGNCKEENRIQALKDGADAFFCKPFPLEDLLKILPPPVLHAGPTGNPPPTPTAENRN